MTTMRDSRKAPPWLPLLRQLTDGCGSWIVWKNVDAALIGDGDIDSAAADEEWPRVEAHFREWATAHGLGPVVVCRHIPGGLNLIAVPDGMSTFLELSAKQNKIFRGTTLFELEDLTPLAEMDPRGFRRVRPGAEGVFKLLLNGSKWGGRRNLQGLESKNVPALLRDDPAGVRMAARLFGRAERAILALAGAVERGGWRGDAMLAVEVRSIAKGLGHPRVLARRARFRLFATQQCPVVDAILNDHRRIPADRDAWLRRVAAGHAVYQ